MMKHAKIKSKTLISFVASNAVVLSNVMMDSQGIQHIYQNYLDYCEHNGNDNGYDIDASLMSWVITSSVLNTELSF